MSGATAGQAHPLDLAAMAAYGAYYELSGPQAAEEWTEVREEVRVHWRATADAVRMTLDLAAQERPAPASAVGDATPGQALAVTEAQLAGVLEGLGVDINDGGFLAAGIIDRPAEVARALFVRLNSARLCRTCDGSGVLQVPDSDGESASEQDCPEPLHDAAQERPAPAPDDLREPLAKARMTFGELAADNIRLRALVAEIIERIEQLGVIGSKNDNWRERAELAGAVEP